MSTKRKSADVPESEDEKKSKLNGHWATGLISSMENAEYFVQSDNLVVVIKDKYPKAEYHYLVIPKENINSLKTVKAHNLALLKHMHRIGEKLAAEPRHEGKTFKLGYHAEASMLRLHLHVLSDDMNSPCVKTKKHWNSFNTDFFLDSKDVCNTLESEQKITVLSGETCKRLLATPLKCHKCDFVPKHMPDLKKHILKHEK